MPVAVSSAAVDALGVVEDVTERAIAALGANAR